MTSIENAAAKIGIKCVRNHAIRLPNGTQTTVAVWFPHIGGERGAIILAYDEDNCQLSKQLGAFGFHVSLFTADPTKGVYNPESLKIILGEWGWFGPPQLKPSWFDKAAEYWMLVESLDHEESP
jgi:hypothetical protein